MPDLTTTITPGDVAIEMGKDEPVAGSVVWQQWSSWIDRAVRAIQRRAERLRVDVTTLDPRTVDDVVLYAVVRRITRPVDGATSVTEQVSVDDGSVNDTRRFSPSQGDIHFLSAWWSELGLVDPAEAGWAGSMPYAR